MSRYGNLKGGPDGVVTPEDLRCWRDLVAGAKAVAAEPTGAAPSFAKVSRAARNACAPGVITRDNPCIQLSRLSAHFVAETAAGRRDLATALRAAADKAGEQLTALDEAPKRRERKDIDG